MGWLPWEPGPEEGWSLSREGQPPTPAHTHTPIPQAPEGQDQASPRPGEERVGSGPSPAQQAGDWLLGPEA